MDNGSGKVVYRALYTPFGQLLSETNPSPHEPDYTFTHQEFDKAIALQDFNARMYTAKLGRFTSVDPIQHPEESSYAYVSNNPLNRIDLLGQQSVRIQINNPWGRAQLQCLRWLADRGAEVNDFLEPFHEKVRSILVAPFYFVDRFVLREPILSPAVIDICLYRVEDMVLEES